MTLAGYPGMLAGFGPPFLNVTPLVTTGKMFFVSSVTGLANNVGDDSLRPLATISQAIAKCRANKGDHIILLPGHVETITTAGGVTVDKAGVTVIGMGFGAQRPAFTFSTITGASFLISAVDFKMYNVVGVSGVDALTNPFSVQASGCSLDIEWQDTAAATQAVRAVLAGSTAAISNFFLKLRVLGQTAGGTAPVNAVRLGGAATSVTTGIIQADFYGRASTAFVEFVTLASVDIQVTGTMYNSGTTDGSKNVIDTVGGSTWMVNVFDATAGQEYSGGSGLTPVLGSGALTVPAADVATNVLERDVIGNKTDAAVVTVGTTKSILAYAKGVLTNLLVPTADVVTNTNSRDVVGNKTDATIDVVGTTKSVVAYLKGVLNDLSGAGIVTFPASALPANAVNIAQVLREIYDQADKGVTSSTVTLVNGATVFTITGGAIFIRELAAVCVTGNDATASTVQWQANPTAGVATTISGASASIANKIAGDAIVLNATALATAPDLRTPFVTLGSVKTNGIIVDAGTIKIVVGVGSTTGTWKHIMRFSPLQRGVVVT